MLTVSLLACFYIIKENLNHAAVEKTQSIQPASYPFGKSAFDPCVEMKTVHWEHLTIAGSSFVLR